ncbi:hypothetical protein DEO72_LG5g2259 [Vigna unguiculata]|uniref:Uncharacterized protein n=1 Tax=Vigna unguiculata TaxID=3917 RepID=A0A4D6LYY7_VIGUN|nr:hypothetical protein DEO72_LG5g2258 [Vigna unguiculata]QCD94179.1 hypothetical protein DEO72_LG5g2259 [Vigna unguiculata]
MVAGGSRGGLAGSREKRRRRQRRRQRNGDSGSTGDGGSGNTELALLEWPEFAERNGGETACARKKGVCVLRPNSTIWPRFSLQPRHITPFGPGSLTPEA